jgi:SAM-dependent methyltransferase
VESVTGLAPALTYWRTRHQTAPAGWAARYWDDLGARHRPVIQQAIEQLAPTSVLEVGCNAGPNLRRLAQVHRTMRFVGIDCNTEALTLARDRAQAEGWGERVEWIEGDWTARLASWSARSIDVVLHAYVLAYLPPERLLAALAALGRVARRGVVGCEPDGPGPSRWVGEGPEWQHDYHPACRQTWPMAPRQVWPLIPPVDRATAVWAVTLAEESC